MAKVMISMPDELLLRIDEAAKSRKMTRSAFLQEAADRELREAAERKFQKPTAEGIERALKKGRAILANAGRGTSDT